MCPQATWFDSRARRQTGCSSGAERLAWDQEVVSAILTTPTATTSSTDAAKRREPVLDLRDRRGSAANDARTLAVPCVDDCASRRVKPVVVAIAAVAQW